MKQRRVLFPAIIVLLTVVAVVPLALANREVNMEGVPEVQQAQTEDITTVLTSTVVTPTVITAVSLPAAARNTPAIVQGPLSGEVTAKTAVVWARANQAGEIVFTISSDPEFAEDVTEVRVKVDEDSDFIGEAFVDDLTPGTPYLYRAALTDKEETSEFVQGYFVTAPAADEPVPFNFTFSACLGGQGYCRDPENGWLIFEAMQAQSPDFFLLTGDSVYVDSACPASNNVPGAEGPFVDLDGFRSRYRYHLEDPPYANFLAQTPVYVTWDDHEIHDDFGGLAFSHLNPQLVADGITAFFDYWPLQRQADDTPRIYRSFSYGAYADLILLDTRSYRDPNVNWDPHPRDLTPKTMLGAEQFAWLQETLLDSTATWKFIVTSVPLSYPTGFPQPEVDGRDGWANYTEKSGYETELMSLLFFIESNNIENVVFLTGDTHWPFAISYDPDRDGTVNFYEFGASPMSALTLPPVDKPDPTFNPTVLYAEGEFAGTLFNFGHISVDEDGLLTFRVLDWEGTERYAVTVTPVVYEDNSQ